MLTHFCRARAAELPLPRVYTAPAYFTPPRRRNANNFSGRARLAAETQRQAAAGAVCGAPRRAGGGIAAANFPDSALIAAEFGRPLA